MGSTVWTPCDLYQNVILKNEKNNIVYNKKNKNATL